MTSRWIMNMNWFLPEPKPSPPEDKTPSTRKGFRVIADNEDGAADLARARSEAARGRRERAIWPKIDVTISADGSTTGRSFRSDDLISRALELLPLESEADARAFRERLRSTSAILGTSALCAHPDDRGRSMLWYAVDAEDLGAVEAFVEVFGADVAHLVLAAPPDTNPLELADGRGLRDVADALQRAAETTRPSAGGGFTGKRARPSFLCWFCAEHLRRL